MPFGCLTLEIVILIRWPGTISDTIHTNRDFNPLTVDASYAIIYTIIFNCTCRLFLRICIAWYQTCPKCDKKLIGMVKTTGDVPTFWMSPVSGLKTQNCPRKSAVTCTHTHNSGVPPPPPPRPHTHTVTHPQTNYACEQNVHFIIICVLKIRTVCSVFVQFTFQFFSHTPKSLDCFHFEGNFLRFRKSRLFSGNFLKTK